MFTTYDPVTPFDAAKVAVDTFQNPRLVEVKGYGHTTLGLFSKCSFNHIRSYFIDGVLPEKNVQCEVDNPIIRDTEKDG